MVILIKLIISPQFQEKIGSCKYTLQSNPTTPTNPLTFRAFILCSAFGSMDAPRSDEFSKDFRVRQWRETLKMDHKHYPAQIAAAKADEETGVHKYMQVLFIANFRLRSPGTVGLNASEITCMCMFDSTGNDTKTTTNF